MQDAIDHAKSARKAELHMHLEGALRPELLLKFANRNSKPLPYKNVEEIRARYQFTDLPDFIEIYLEGFGSLATSFDYEELLDDYCEHAIQDNICHAEIFIESHACHLVGLTPDQVMEGCIRGQEKWRNQGLEILLIPTFFRERTETEALEYFEKLEPYFKHISAIGLAGGEVGYPPSNFKRLFDAARSAGFKLVSHAGEEGPPEYVWEALDVLGVDRIDHGNRAIEDASLVSRLARDRIPTTMCPLSNLRLCVVDALQSHPLKKFLDAGVIATVNSDDPAYFGGYLNDNYEQIIQALELSKTDVDTLIENSLEASFAPISASS